MSATHGFTLVQERQIPEINSRVRLFHHAKSGAELLSGENEDENKCFGIGFCTPPEDSTGLPHILEHAVLNGSRKYPVKEPFVELLKSSLASFINAVTFADKTVYPVASQNVKDLYNLIDVYVDAVFHPRITPEILKQEGWHYELESPDAPLTFKGVVFNEMKGAYSMPDRVLFSNSRRALLPDTPYGHDSGGDPQVIPDLTYAQFKKFHETYYHPSNARIFFYGDDDPEERLRVMDGYLSEFDARPVNATISVQPTFTAPRSITLPYDAGDKPDARALISVSWLLPDPLDVQRTLSLEILEHILLGTPASPLRKALIDSGLGEDSVNTGLSRAQRQMSFTTGMKGIRAEDTDKVEALILDTLKSLAADGIDPQTVAASMNTTEFQLREYNTGNLPRGLAMVIFAAFSTWLYGGDPIAPLAFEAPLNGVKAALESDSRYFEGLIQQYLVDNTHRSTLLLTPDADLRRRHDEAEKARLADTRASMDEAALTKVIAETETLRQMQETPDSPEALAAIPSLTIADLDRESKTIPLDVSETDGTRVLYHDLFTNGIVYLDVGFDLHALPSKYLPYAGLLSRALLEVGTDKEDFVRLSQRIGSKTGGIRTDTFASQIHDSTISTAWFMLRAKSTLDQTGDMLDILQDMLLSAKLDDRDRLRQIALKEKARVESSLVSNGVSYVATRLASGLHEAGWASEQMGGVSYLFFIRDLIERIASDWDSVQAELEDIRKLLVNRRSALFNITVDDTMWQAIQPRLDAFRLALPEAPSQRQVWSPEYVRVNEALTAPSQINYVGMGGNLYHAGYELHGSVHVITKSLSRTYLWEKIRVQGGAYGGAGTFDTHSGTFSFLSWRDPNLAGTLDNYRRASDFLRKIEMSETDLSRSVVGAIGTLDTYQLPDAKGYTSMRRHLAGITDAMRQQIREEVLATTVTDFRRFGEILSRLNDQARKVVIGSPEAVDTANSTLDDPFEVVPVI